MNEKASQKEGEEGTHPRPEVEAPGIPVGEELALGPVEGDEIDPLPKWWDESEDAERGKAENRRHEEGEAAEAKRSRKPRPAPEEKVEPDPGETVEEAAAEEEAGESSIVGMPEIDLGTIKVKHRPKTDEPSDEEEGDDSSAPPDDPGPAPEKFEDAFEAKPALVPGSAAPAKKEATAPTKPEDETEEAEETTEDVPSPEAESEAEAKPESETVPVPAKEGEGTPTPPPVPVIGDGLVPKEPAASAPAKRKAGCWTVFATLFFIATIGVVGLLVVAAVFAWTQAGKFGEQAAAKVQEKLEAQGFHLDCGSWRYEFPGGLVFDEVTVYDDATKAKPALKISPLAMDVDFLSLAKDPGGLGRTEFSLRDSTVGFYEEGGLSSEIPGVDGEIVADTDGIVVERLAATFDGLRVRIEGKGRSAQPGIDFPALLRAIRPWQAFEGTGGQAPLLTLIFAADAGDSGSATVEGTFAGTGVKWREIEFSSLSAAFRFDPATGVLSLPNVQAGYGGGLIGGTLSIDTASQIATIESLQSTVDFTALLPAYDPAWAERFKAVRFVDAPSLQIVGSLPLAEPAQADIEVRYSHRQGLVYLDGERELPFSDLRGRFRYARGVLETNDATARLFGGEVALNGSANFLRENRPFNGRVDVTGLSLKEAAGWFGQDGAGLSGRLALNFRGTGGFDSGLAGLNGGGDFRIEEAALPQFPVLGSVQSLVGGVVPAFAAKGAGSVTGAYIIESGVLVTSDLAVRNGGARIVVNGSLTLASAQTNFTATADLEPALAAATGLKGKAIQVAGSGPLREPVLKVRQFPIEFTASGLGEVLGTTPESLAGLKDLVGSENAAEVISGTVEEAAALGLDPAVAELLKGLLGGGEPERPLLRAIPQEN